MTLKTRNTFIKAFFLFAIASILFSAVIYFISLNRQIITTPETIRIPAFLKNFEFTDFSFPCLMISFIVISLYILFTTVLVYNFFENTQCSEIIFFFAFLLGFSCELARFITICLSLWQSFSNTLIFFGNIVLFGRISAILSFLFASIVSDQEHRQDIERNFMIIMAISMVLAIIIPMNTAKITSTGHVIAGFEKSLSVIKHLLCILTAVSFIVHGRHNSSSEYIKLSASYIILVSGYALILCGDNFLFLISGTVLLISGTLYYLKSLHNIYLWV